MTHNEYYYLIRKHGKDPVIIDYLKIKLRELNDYLESIPQATDEEYEEYGVHINHCCNMCQSCKYGNDDCPVANCKLKAIYGRCCD